MKKRSTRVKTLNTLLRRETPAVNAVEIDLGALKSNLRSILRRLGPGTKMLAVVKSDAYGHGMVPVARCLERFSEAVYLGVSSAREAFELREAGIRKPVLILGVTHPQDAERVVRARVTSTVSSPGEARVLARAAERAGRPARVHVELDTGMGRLGVAFEQAVRLLFEVGNMPRLALEGAYTHFPSADRETDFSRSQIGVFAKAMEIAGEFFGRPLRWRHMANSAGILAHADAHFNLVRPGIMMYGVNPLGKAAPGLRPVLRLRSKVAFLKDLPAGASVSYGRTFVARRPTRIATVPIGYSSGYGVAFSNRAHVLIGGRRYPVVGRVTMDHIMVDVGRSPVKLWDEVTLIGRSGGEEIRVEELARIGGMIPYEVLCAVGRNVPRIYRNSPGA